MIKQKVSKKHLDVLKFYGIEELYTKLHLFKFEKGEYLCFQGNEIEHVLIFLSGKAKVFHTSPNGRTLLMAYYTKSGLIGDAELMADKNEATSSVQAITEVSCIAIPKYDNMDYLKSNLKFMQVVGMQLARKLHRNTTINAFNILHPLTSRLCAYILIISENGVFREKLTELSEVMGVSYRHLLRTLDNLCDEGLIEKVKGGYVILDKKQLKKRTDGYYS